MRRTLEIMAASKDHQSYDDFEQLILSMIREISRSITIVDELRHKIEKTKGG